MFHFQDVGSSWGTSSNNAEDDSVLLAEIEGLKKKRPRALTEEQKTDILVAYRSLQVEDLKRKKMRPGRKCGKGNYQRRVSSVLDYSSKTVGLTYRDWNRKHEIKVASCCCCKSQTQASTDT